MTHLGFSQDEIDVAHKVMRDIPADIAVARQVRSRYSIRLFQPIYDGTYPSPRLADQAHLFFFWPHWWTRLVACFWPVKPDKTWLRGSALILYRWCEKQGFRPKLALGDKYSPPDADARIQRSTILRMYIH